MYLNIAMKCIVCKQLERRLIGLGYMQHLVSIARNAVFFPEGIVSPPPGADGVTSHFRVETSSWLTPAMLVDCLVVRGAFCLVESTTAMLPSTVPVDVATLLSPPPHARC